MRRLALVFVAFLAFTNYSFADTTSSELMIDLGSHRLQMRQAGQGAPVVVIDAGLADLLDRLIPLQDSIANYTRVVIYNRAGYGKSEIGPLPRNAEREADELKTMLEKASISGPYLLVGHSLGALNMQIFASKYPNAVAGIVLLDPPPLPFILGKDFQELREMAERMTAEWQAIADSGAKSSDAGEKMKAGFFSMIASEHREMFGETGKQVNAITTFGNIPLIVMASEKPNPAFGELADKFQKFWIEQSRALARKSTHGKFILVEEASHSIYIDDPELTVKTILDIVSDIRSK
jgi:pimeloyl-ACP methyl ester carboxylesterase